MKARQKDSRNVFFFHNIVWLVDVQHADDTFNDTFKQKDTV
jgi:hypothetical protein